MPKELSARSLRKSIITNGYTRSNMRKKKPPGRLKAKKSAVMYELEQKHGRTIEEILLEGDAKYIQELLGIKQSTVYLWWDYFGIVPVRFRAPMKGKHRAKQTT